MRPYTIIFKVKLACLQLKIVALCMIKPKFSFPLVSSYLSCTNMCFGSWCILDGENKTQYRKSSVSQDIKDYHTQIWSTICSTDICNYYSLKYTTHHESVPFTRAKPHETLPLSISHCVIMYAKSWGRQFVKSLVTEIQLLPPATVFFAR